MNRTNSSPRRSLSPLLVTTATRWLGRIATCLLIWIVLRTLGASSPLAPTSAGLDTDGDGQSDAAELRAGTDPKSAASVFRMLGLPVRIPGGGWRFNWSSVAGRRYVLQRWTNPAPDSKTVPPWTDVVTVTASTNTCAANDPTTVDAARQFYRVRLLEQSVVPGGVSFGAVNIGADRFSTNGTIITPVGNVRIGTVTLASDATSTVDAAQGTLSGQGKVSLAGIGPVFEGAFRLDLNTGILKPAPGFGLNVIPLNSRTRLTPTELTLDVVAGTLSGKGGVELQVPSAGIQPQNLRPAQSITLGPVTLTGDFKLDPSRQALTVIGKAVYARVEGSGTATVSLSDQTFELQGELAFTPSAQAASMRLQEARFSMRLTDNQGAEFVLSGRPIVPALASLSSTLAGTMDTQGNVRLVGQGTGVLGNVHLSPLTLALGRSADAGANVELRFTGAAQVEGLSSLTWSGRLETDGSLAEMTTSVALGLGNGIRLEPRVDDQGRSLPLLTLRGSRDGVSSFEVNALFLAPAAQGTTPLEVAGALSLERLAEVTRLQGFGATNRNPLPSISLPGSLRLEGARLELSRNQGRSEARFIGDLVIARNGALITARVPADLQLEVRNDDPQDISIDSKIGLSNVSLKDQV